MANKLIEYQFRIRNAADSANALTVTSVRGGTNPYISAVPSGDGASFDPNTGVVTSGSYTVRIADPITSGTDRLFSSLLEDSGGRQQLGHRRAYIEYREDGGAYTVLYCGRVSRYALVSDIEWEIEVSDWMQAEHETTAFNPSLDDNITDFLATWPNRGCLVGGPVIGGWLNIPDLGGWICRVKDASGGSAVTRYRLEPVSVYGPGKWLPGSDIFTDDPRTGFSPAAHINTLSHSLPRGIFDIAERSSFTTIRHAFERCDWPGLVTLIDDVPWRPIHPGTGGVVYSGEFGNAAYDDLISGKPGQLGLFVIQDGQANLTIDSTVRVRVLTIRPSEVSPIYFDGHHVDWIESLYDEAGIPLDATTQETVRDTLGAAEYFAGQFTKPEPVGSLLEATSYGPKGIGARQGTDGEVELFATRSFSSTAPATTIDEDDVVEGTTHAFSLSTREAIARYRLEHKQFGGAGPTGNTADGVTSRQHRYEFDSSDPGSIGTGEVSYDVPGMLHGAETKEDNLFLRAAGDAALIYERYTRGPIRLVTTLLPTGAGANAKLGDEFLFDLPQMPKGNKRLGDAVVAARAMQIVHLTRTPVGIEVECLDSWPNAAQHGTVPTLSKALSTDRPRNVATYTITNAATLNGQSAACRVQMAVDTGGGAPAAEDYSDVAYFEHGVIPTTAQRLPAVTNDCTAYIRARAEKWGVRPSNWSSTANQVLDPLDPPSAVAGTPSGTDKSQCAVVWTIGTDSDDAHVEVWLSLASEVFADAEHLITLPPGSDRFTIYYNFVASTAYTVYIRHRDLETGDVSDPAEDDFTTNSTTVTLAAPTNPYGFSVPAIFGGNRSRTLGGSPGLFEGAGRYGMVVKATEIPGFVEVQEAVEDSVGAGTYGAYATVATAIPSEAGGWTFYTSIASSDGLRRKLKARHVRDSATSSSYTSEVIVTPGTNSVAPQFPLEFSAIYATAVTLTVNNPLFSNAGNTLDVTWSSTGLPSGTKFNVSFTQNGSDGVSGYADDVTSTYQFTSVTGATGTGSVRVDAVYNGALLATKTRAGTWAT